MFSGFEKMTDSADKNFEQAPQIPEMHNIPSMDDLRVQLDEIFPMSPDVGDGRGEGQIQDTGESRPREVILDDGTVVTLPSPPDSVLHNAKTGYDKAGRSSETDMNRLDDNGKPYMNDDGGFIPNNTYEIDGTVYKTDDRGEIYSVDGRLYPNDTYKLNGNVYTTDDNGRIIDVRAVPTLSPENPRDNDAQKDAGGKDRQGNDQGGHIVGRDMGGDGGEGNLVAMDSRINQSDYKKMENDIKRTLTEGKDVSTHTEITYNGDSERPDVIKVTTTADGKETVYTYDNNINGTLRERAGDVGGEDAAVTMQAVLDETGGEVSSVKEEHDKNGNLVNVTMNITYTGENGKTQRTKVVIDHPQGGNGND